ncbi:MAG: signal peptidase II [Lachnospiraceae bacterium]|nr:signal peptidase II [Lachnospiraceae bacterium]
MDSKKRKLLIFDVLLMIVLAAADQFTKYLAVIKLKDQPSFDIISGVLELSYLENRGAAFGMLQNQKVFFVFVAVVFLCAIVYVLLKAPSQNKYYSLHFLLVMIAAGAIGNLIDRLRLDYVVDFIYIVLINFPIFNVADMYVTISAAILVILMLFVYKEEDFAFLGFHQAQASEAKEESRE